MQINYILLGQRIRAFRTKKGITQMELAERIDRSAAYMSYVETAYKFCSLDTLVRVANELNVSTDDLLIDSLEDMTVGFLKFCVIPENPPVLKAYFGIENAPAEAGAQPELHHRIFKQVFDIATKNTG